MTTYIIHGPKGCGKTHNAKALAAHFKTIGVVDNWTPDKPLTPNALHLAIEPPASVLIEVPNGRVRVLSFGEACAAAGIPPCEAKPAASVAAQAKQILDRAHIDASIAAARAALPGEVERAALIAKVRRIHYDAAIAQGFAPCQALVLCQNTTAS